MFLPSPLRLGPARRVLRDRVAVLALLLQALADLRLGMETRGAEIDSALVVLGLQTSPGGSNSSRQTGTTSTTAESSSRSRASSAISDSSKGTEEPIPEMPNLADCEAAVDAMVTKTEHGMREGLRLLRLPTSPLHFVPGSELRLRGHDIRVAVCSLIAHWLEDEKPAFFDVLQRIHQVLRKEAPPARDSLATSELVTLRETLRAERRALLDQLEGLDERLRVIDEQLNLPTVVQDVQVSTESGTLFNCGAKQSASEDKTVEPRLNAGCQLAGALSGIAETLAVENQRSVERFGAQLQLRRAELLSALREHLAAEEGRLSALVVAPSGVVNAAQVAAEAVYGAFEENRQLCDLVQKALGPASSQVSELCAGSRCRARWMDGNYYDATIHTVLPDGSVVVNWLRPRPGHECKAMLSQGLDDVAPADEDEDDDHGCGNDGDDDDDDDDDVDHGEDED
ncbi:Arfgap2, partial [Symbiodinium microadriaticum]